LGIGGLTDKILDVIITFFILDEYGDAGKI
jgi:hypothetical protein